MAYTFTATAFANQARQVHAGLNAVSVITTSPAAATLSASANASVFLMCKIPNHAVIVDVIESHSSGAATNLADVGIDDTISAFCSQVTQGQINRGSVVAGFPYRVNNADTAIPSYSIVKVGFAPGTDTAVCQCRLTVLYHMSEPDITA